MGIHGGMHGGGGLGVYIEEGERVMQVRDRGREGDVTEKGGRR